MCAGVMISLNRFRSSLISLFSTAVRKVDAPLIVLVCELSASRSLLIDAINPSVIGYRGTRFRVCHWRYNSDCQSFVKKDLETKKIILRDISSFTAAIPILSFFTFLSDE